MLALLVLHRAKLLASNQSILALCVAPMRVVSRWCRCIVQRLCATDCKRPCLVRAAAPHSAPFPGKGFGDRDNKLEVHFKNRLFLQSATPIAYAIGVNIKFDVYLYLPFWIFFINCRRDISPVLTFQESSCSSFQLL